MSGIVDIVAIMSWIVVAKAVLMFVEAVVVALVWSF
jgi:hypothetical protein